MQLDTAAQSLDRASAVGPWRETGRAILRQRSALAGAFILALLVAVAVLADVLASHSPNQVLLGIEDAARARQAPCIHLLGCPSSSPEHWLGLDGNVRDLWSRVVHGARVSLYIGIVTVGFAIISGGLLGAIAGYRGGWVDSALMRLMDVILAFPALILAIAIVTVLGPGLIQAQLAIGFVAIPVYARVMRSSVLSVRNREFVTASKALGDSDVSILIRHVLPNALTPLIVQATLGVAAAILEVAALSFIGLGTQPPTAEWGSMIGLERNAAIAAPHLIFGPGVAISLTVLGFNLLGDGLRDALDPRLGH